MPLESGLPDPVVVEQLDEAFLERLFGKEIIVNRTAARLCVAGLWLLYDHLDKCHNIAQSVETQDGSYWHAIMHRREGDYSNSKYWFRRVREHEIFTELTKQFRQSIIQESGLNKLLDGERWNPFAFVEICEKAVNREPKLVAPCKHIQQIEWQLLFDHNYRKAIGL